MYVPPYFREKDRDRLIAAMGDIQFASLVSATPDGLETTHMPLFVRADGDNLILEGHMARPNTHWRAADTATQTVAIFQGPQAYISPGWYPTKKETGKVVPTWNYIVVQAHGSLSIMASADELHAHLHMMTDRNEAARSTPWSVDDAPDDYMGKMMRGIVGIRLTVADLEGVWKLAQQKAEQDRRGAAAGLLGTADADSLSIGAMMAAREMD